LLKYLPGVHGAGAFKEGGNIIRDMYVQDLEPIKLPLNTPGIYTFFVRDYEGNIGLGRINVQ
jgi:hypothetical protein